MVRLKTIDSTVGAEVVIDGRRYVNFGGSSYLGLSSNLQIIEAGLSSLRANGAGYQVPREFGVATQPHQDAEAAAAGFFGSEAALYLAAGYHFGFVAIAALRARFDVIFFDDWAHYALREAIAASGLPAHPFQHLAVEQLETQLKQHLRANERPLIVSDGLYATFGEIAPVAELAQVAERYDGHLVIDESHSFGVLGDTGRGSLEHHGVSAAIASVGGSTSKALGAVGGIVPASCDAIVAFRATRLGRGASSGLPACAAMCACSLRYVRAHPELLLRLRANTAYMKSGLRTLGLVINDSIAPVATFTTAPDQSMIDLQQRLMAEGIHVFHTTYIGASSAGVIRCGIFADHTTEQIDYLLGALRRLL